ncbi:hypothetical protein EIP91_007211 [Steccherinum ochraceum]|uniref:Leucine-zipper-like transcriptional regulator 1 n=1 Tax=Steccherinum ochraceum TaxID=92696 RepID=A0A4R0R4M6_9APHY|nr:hypothetical protein EIP91_007211 [Steccherinum ochraceum]
MSRGNPALLPAESAVLPSPSSSSRFGLLIVLIVPDVFDDLSYPFSAALFAISLGFNLPSYTIPPSYLPSALESDSLLSSRYFIKLTPILTIVTVFFSPLHSLDNSSGQTEILFIHHSPMGVVDSPRLHSLQDVPEDVSISAGRSSSPHPGSLYMHPSMSGSTSTFKGTSAVGSSVAASASTSSLSSVTSPTRPLIGPRNPSSLRTSSANSLVQHPLEAGATTPTSATTPTNGVASALTHPAKDPVEIAHGIDQGERPVVGQGVEEQTTACGAGRRQVLKRGGERRLEDEEQAVPVFADARSPSPGSSGDTHVLESRTGVRADAGERDAVAWIFGGCDERGCWKDIWCFNTETMQWSHPEMYGDIPPPCRAHTATLVDRRLVFFGGGEGPVYRNDIYILDTVTRRWQQPKFPKHVRLPPPRRAHTSVFFRNKVWIFGGGNGTQALNDLWTLDVGAVSVEKMRWEEVETKGKKPTARGYHTANLVGNVMVVMGGSDGRECFSDIWCLNLETFIWSQVRLDVSHRRLSHTATQVGSYLYIWGGHDGTQYTSDLLLFNLVALAFESRTISGKPPAPRGYHATIIADSRLFVVGGFNGNEVFEDVHILDLAGAAYLPQVTSFKIDVD